MFGGKYSDLGATYLATPAGSELTQSTADSVCKRYSNKVLIQGDNAIYCTPTNRAIIYRNIDQWMRIPIKDGKSAMEICVPPYWGSGKARVMECVEGYRTKGARRISEAERAKERYRQRQEKEQEKLVQEVMQELPPSTAPGIPMKTWLLIGGIGAAAIILTAPKKGKAG